MNMLEGQFGRPKPKQCRVCHGYGHWSRDCPQKVQQTGGAVEQAKAKRTATTTPFVIDSPQLRSCNMGNTFCGKCHARFSDGFWNSEYRLRWITVRELVRIRESDHSRD